MKKRILSGILAMATALALAACGSTPTEPAATTTGANGETAAPVAEADDTTTAVPETTTTTTTERTTNTTMEALNEAVGALSGNLPDITVEKKLKYLSWYELDETQATTMLFKETYGIPEQGVVYGTDSRLTQGATEEEIGDMIFVLESVVYADRYTRLATLIQAGDSPDIMDYEYQNYPYGMFKGMYSPVGELLGTDGEAWAEYRGMMDEIMWDGKDYAPIYNSPNLDQILWYRKSVAEDAGIDDPYEQFKEGTWDWTAFMDACAAFSSPEENKYCLDGWNPERAFVSTTGNPLIGIEGGKLTSYLYDANIERVMTIVLEEMAKQNYVYPRENNGWTINYSAWANGDTLFFCDGIWGWGDAIGKYNKAKAWDEDEVCVVPFPKDPEADQHYRQGRVETFMLPAGAQNTEGYKAYLYCCLVSSADEDVAATAREKTMIDSGIHARILDAQDEIRALTPVFDYSAGIGQDIADTSNGDMPVEQLTKGPYTQDKTYNEVRSTNEGQIVARIDEINASIGQ
jgi:multiple sugar transport system substrate-binding protein